MDSLHKYTAPRKATLPLASAHPVSEPEKEVPLAKDFSQDFRTKKMVRNSVFSLFFGLFFLCLTFLGFLLFRGFSASQNMQFENKSGSFFTQMKGLTTSLFSEKRTPLRGEREGRINILLLGRAGEHYPGKNLTDTVMVMSIDINEKKVALLSLPRDLYVPIHETDLYTKLNSLYQYGLSDDRDASPVKKTVEDITGQPIHYFLTVDFDSFEKIIDTLDGIQVNALRDFYDTRYPGKNYSYETFELKKGWQTLDGKTALKYVRERHDDPEGDFGRAKRQQQVLQAVKEKAFSAGTLFNIFTLNSLLGTLGENIKTDISLEDMGKFLDLSRTIDTQNITSIVVDAWKKESLLRVSHIQIGPIAAFILVPRVGNWSEIQEASENIFHLDDLQEKNRHISSENPTITVIYTKENAGSMSKIRELIEEIGFQKNTYIETSSLAVSPEKSIIIDRSALSKPFSLNELLKKFSLEQRSALPLPLSQKEDSDFVIVIGNDMAESVSLEDSTEKIPVDEPVYGEELPPSPKAKSKK